MNHTQTKTSLQVSVWDTYVPRTDGRMMHFDIIAPSGIRDPEVIHTFGRDYLHSKGFINPAITARECRFCHVEIVRPEWSAAIREKGYYIYEMENCS